MIPSLFHFPVHWELKEPFYGVNPIKTIALSTPSSLVVKCRASSRSTDCVNPSTKADHAET